VPSEAIEVPSEAIGQTKLNRKRQTLIFATKRQNKKVPSEAIEVPSEAIPQISRNKKVPSEAIEVPSEAIQVPSEAIEISIKAIKQFPRMKQNKTKWQNKNKKKQ
jgi:hypothetical protein